MAVGDYDADPNNNNTISGTNVAEGCAPSGLNNAIRQIMADLAAYVVPTSLGGTGSSDPATARSNLGLGTAATAAATDFSSSTQGDASAASIAALGTSSAVDTGTASGEVALRSTDGHIPLYAPLLHVRDEKSANTDGGTFSSGAWRTRDLNTVLTNEIASAALSSNQISLPAGTYDVLASAPSRATEHHKAILYDVTNAANLIVGTSELAKNFGDARDATRSLISGRITLAGVTLLEVRHRANTTGVFGIASNFGVVEVYTDVQIRRVG